MPFLVFAAIALIGAAIAYLGDVYGHLHQAAIHDNHAPDNAGLTLWADFIAPLVAIGLHALLRRASSVATRHRPDQTRITVKSSKAEKSAS